MADEAMNPLRRRMIEDMKIRKLAPKTQHDDVQRVKNFAAFLGRSPDMASFEDVRRYQLHLATSGVGVPTINQTVSTLRFFFRVTLTRHDIFRDRGPAWRKANAGHRVEEGAGPQAGREQAEQQGAERAQCGACDQDLARVDAIGERCQHRHGQHVAGGARARQQAGLRAA